MLPMREGRTWDKHPDELFLPMMKNAKIETV